ncbi:sodium-coupled monocarboxylate transporter 1-like isoform X1 [Ornithodoros turicata]|uniref:sodium-coupled monocarboxylate transporter 1-like isoform X1 n=2 Tax=Ornithodoros turicata TaxID=34597 RepID=UPI0031389C9E
MEAIKEYDMETLSNRFTVWDYVVFSGMLCVSAAIGIYYAFSGSKQSTTAEFLMGNRSMGVVPVALSILASFMSAITLLGTASEMYIYGTQYIVILFAYCLVIPAAAYLYLPVFYNLQLTSMYEYLEIRFHHVVRVIGTLTFLLQMIVYMAIVLYAPSLALSQVTGISVWTSVLSIGIICTFYTSVGGIKAVIWTDVFQVLLMFGAMLTVAVKGSYDLGGFSKVIEKAREGQRLEFFNFNVDPTDRHTVWGLIFGCYFTWEFVYGASQAMVQRYLTLPTLRKARIAIWMNLPGLSFLMLICSMAGLVIYANYSTCDPKLTKHITADDQLLPLYVMEILGTYPGLPGLFVSGIFSGALSTVSSGVNSLAAVVLEDIVKRYIKSDMSDKFATNLTKGLAMSFGLIAIVLVYVAQNLGGVLQAALAIFGMMGGPLLGVFTLGLFFPWANAIGATVGTLASLAACFWIGIGAFVLKPVVPRAPVSVEGCISIYLNVTNSTVYTPPAPQDFSRNDDIFVLYRLSYVWYSAIGCFLVIIIGMVTSLSTGCTKPSNVDPRTIHPLYNYVCKILLPSSLHDKFLVPTVEESGKGSLVRLPRPESDLGKENPAFCEEKFGSGQLEDIQAPAAAWITEKRPSLSSQNGELRLEVAALSPEQESPGAWSAPGHALKNNAALSHRSTKC